MCCKVIDLCSKWLLCCHTGALRDNLVLLEQCVCIMTFIDRSLKCVVVIVCLIPHLPRVHAQPGFLQSLHCSCYSHTELDGQWVRSAGSDKNWSSNFGHEMDHKNGLQAVRRCSLPLKFSKLETSIANMFNRNICKTSHECQKSLRMHEVVWWFKKGMFHKMQ